MIKGRKTGTIIWIWFNY